jgi:hypothetical protein
MIPPMLLIGTIVLPRLCCRPREVHERLPTVINGCNTVSHGAHIPGAGSLGGAS